MIFVKKKPKVEKIKTFLIVLEINPVHDLKRENPYRLYEELYQR
jgi:hypothetical protein